jgi:DnaJ domain
MASQFEVAGSCATSHDGYEPIPSLDQGRPKPVWRFVDEFQQLLGDDSAPDPQFFVESWTFGMNAAVDNYQQRRQKKATRQARTFEEFDDLVNLSINQDSEASTEYRYSGETSMYTGSYETGWKLRSSEEHAAQMQCQYPEDLDAPEFDALDEAFNKATAYPMTLTDAFQLLEVTENSTRQQIRAAYRIKVSQWHPDRLDRRSEQVRQRATAQMAAINEAYRLLCTGLAQK